MNRMSQSPQVPVSDPLQTRAACRLDGMPHIGGYFGGPWAELYRYAYQLALEQTTEEADRLRRLGHVAPGVN